MEIRLDVLREAGSFPRVERYEWSGATASIYRLVDNALVLFAVMQVGTFASEDDALGLQLTADLAPFEADILFNEYAGTTGAEGGADIKGQPKPWAFGRCQNAEGVFIDQIDNVWQVSGYGPVSAIPMVYERGAAFGASNFVDDYATYTALVAANIPEGRWGTCLAQGMFRLGAPPAGVVTADVDGDTTTGFLRRTGAIIKEIARRLNLAARMDTASLDALDAAVPWNVNYYIGQQITLLDFARQVARPCNAVAGVGLDGRLIAPRVAFGVEQMTLDAQGRQMPPVLGMARRNTQPPYKRIQFGAARSWRVHTFDEVAFIADLIERGLYNALQIYREGDLIESADKSRWVYINAAASSGNAPPVWPTTSNAFWDNIAPPISVAIAPANSNLVQFSRMEGDRGWEMAFNPSGLAFNEIYGEFAGLRFFTTLFTATAAGQIGVIAQEPAPLAAFPVASGGRLSVQSRILAQGTSSWLFSATWVRSDGTRTQATVASGAGTINTLGFQQAFLDVPSDSPPVVGGYLDLVGESAGAGVMQLAFVEPMVASAAPGQTGHPSYTPGPNAVDGALPNNLITIDGTGLLNGIGTGTGTRVSNNAITIDGTGLLNGIGTGTGTSVSNGAITIDGTGLINGIGTGTGTSVNNGRNLLRGALTDLPATGDFTGQQFSASNTGDVRRWSGAAWVAVADITTAISGASLMLLDYTSADVLINSLPSSEMYALTARGGSAFTSGVSWSAVVTQGTFSGTAPTITGTGTAQLDINSGLASPEATIRITATVGGLSYPPFLVTVRKVIAPAIPASSGAFASDSTFTAFSTTSFAAITDVLTVVLPTEVTVATLTASSLTLRTANTNTPTGETNCEFKWQRESSPGTWTDVGAVATSSPHPGVIDDGDGFRFRQLGSVTCNRSATGLGAGSTQTFRMVARVSGGNTRSITMAGTASVQG
jgi:hypothetical protein